MKTLYDKTLSCPCRSGKSYEECCQPFHEGKLPDNALKLMRSRYAAYALCLPGYIIETTHPANPHFSPHTLDWKQNIAEFSASTAFKGLEILEFEENNPYATVTFFAHLTQNDQDVSFTEKSIFEKVNNKWFYLSGEVSEGHSSS